MSINGVLRTSVSGMNAQANRLSAVGDNIANQSTTGYKRADVEFSNLVLDAGGADYTSGAVQSETRRNISAQGAIVGSSNATDLAIQGNGFFVVEGANGGEAYTRAGAFVQRFDTEAQQTYLVNSGGYRLTGQNLQTGANEAINLPVGQIFAPTATDTIDLSTLQLPVGDEAQAAPIEPEGYNYKTSVTVYDSVGTPTTLDMTATKTADNAWTVSFYERGGAEANAEAIGTATLAFDPATGKPTAAVGPITLPGDGASRPEVTVNLGNVTEYDGTYSAQMEPNGNPASAVKDFTVSREGIVSAVLESGDTVEIYRARMANFKSPDQMEALTGDVFRPTRDSGVAQFGFAGENGFGTTQSGALEQSTVDIASELTLMIESQRAYTANSKTFQTGSEMLDVLINLKR